MTRRILLGLMSLFMAQASCGDSAEERGREPPSPGADSPNGSGEGGATGSSGTVSGGGSEEGGPPGDGGTAGVGTPDGGGELPCSAGLLPKPGGGCTTAVAVDVGENHACALGAAGQIACWGQNENGQLGASPVAVASASRPRLVPGLGPASALAVGARHSCAVVGGGVMCWGGLATAAGSYLGQLGHGGAAGSASPVAVSALANVQSLVASKHTTCALDTSGALRCWGFGGLGQLGNGSAPITQTTPATAVAAVGLGTITSMAAGAGHFCAINGAGEVWCWGENVLLKVGVSSGTTISTPVKVAGLGAAASLVLGDGFSCARLVDSSVWCWGDGSATNNCVTSANPPMTSCTATHVPRVRTGFQASLVFGGAEQICGLSSPSGAPACLGMGQNGRLGDGVDHGILFVQSPKLLVAPASSAKTVDFGASAGCALLTTGQVSCWGANPGGQLGNGTTTSASPTVPGFIAP